MAKQIRIGFIQAINAIDARWYRPLSFGYLKSHIDKYFFGRAEIVFLESLDDLDGFDIVGVSAASQDFFIAQNLAKQIKDANQKIVTVLGGQHISYLPESLPADFDIGVIGEGEETFREIVQCYIDSGNRLDQGAISEIKGIVCRKEGKLTATGRRELICPLDTLGFPHREKGAGFYLFTSRGCPYKCAFCASSAFWDKTRFFSAGYVVGEIQHVLRQFPGTKHIEIWDDLFVADRQRLKQIVGLFRERGLDKEITLSVSVRADLVTDDLCEDLKKINVITVGFGAESGSDRVLEFLRKNTSMEKNQMALDSLHKHGIKTVCSFIIGSPTETEKELRDTYDFILKNIADDKMMADCPINILMPMPGTKIWDYAVEKRIIDPDNIDWNRLSVFADYRQSKIENLSAWIQYRRNKRSVYLAEETLPQERLYEIMLLNEKIIAALAKNKRLREKEKMLDSVLSSRSWRYTAFIRRCVNFFKGEKNG